MLDGINAGSFQVTNLDNPYTPSKIVHIMTSQYKGAVTYDGFWQSEPAAGWTIEKLGVGSYRVNHYQANPNYSVNCQLDVGVVGGPQISNTGPNSFDVQVNDGDGNPMDKGFGFAISFTS